jgi:hypothetical protein
VVGFGLEASALARADLPGQVAATPLLQYVGDLVAEALATFGGREVVVAGCDVHLLADGDTFGTSSQRTRRVHGDGHIAGGRAKRPPHLHRQRSGGGRVQRGHGSHHLAGARRFWSIDLDVRGAGRGGVVVHAPPPRFGGNQRLSARRAG